MPNRYAVAEAAKAAFEDLVEHIDFYHRPASGWHEAAKLPFIEHEEYAVIARANPAYLDDIVIDVTKLADDLDKDYETAREGVTTSYFQQLEKALKDALLAALQVHADEVEGERANDTCAELNFTGTEFADFNRGVRR